MKAGYLATAAAIACVAVSAPTFAASQAGVSGLANTIIAMLMSMLSLNDGSSPVPPTPDPN